MITSTMPIFITILFISSVCSIIEAKCVIDPSVNGTERSRQEELLQKLEGIDGASSEPEKTTNGYIYDFVVCGSVKGYENVSLTQTVPGSPNMVKFFYYNQTLVYGEGSYLMMVLHGNETCEKPCNTSSKRQAHIMFTCDPFVEKIQIRTLGNLTKDTCDLHFAVAHKTLCPKAPQEGLGGGAIFFILLLVTFGAYFIFGFFYLRLVKGAKGIEQIPNLHFWFKCGNILADGCGAICRCDQYCGAGGGTSPSSTYSGYSPIEERMAQDLQEVDRDSALLSP